ncbi:MAG TPA: phosphoribosylglycinamide formyltransferase [Burkholderiales bacterium]|nr:phosphoribosylglycinamide formyltransferase [Burkholderiales bacterium]
MKSIVVLISGRGSNLEAILKARLPAKVAAVISNNPQAKGLAIARAHGIEALALDRKQFASREAFDAELASRIAVFKPDLIALAGFMLILGDEFVERFANRIINIHPSLLPAFPGLDTHARALQVGVKIHGCTVHFVTSKLDYGPIIIQAAVPVLAADNEATLAARVLKQEHRIYPQAIRWFVEDRLVIEKRGVRVIGAKAGHTALFSPGVDE